MEEFVLPQFGFSAQLELPDQEMINRTAEVFMSDEIPEMPPQAGKLTEAIYHIEVFPGPRGGGVGVYHIQDVQPADVKIHTVVDAQGSIHITSTIQVPVPIDHIDGHRVYKRDKKDKKWKKDEQ